MHQWHRISRLEGRIALCMTEMVKVGGKGELFESLGLVDVVICYDWKMKRNLEQR